MRAGIVALSETLKKRAIEFKHTPIIGRTHGIHAEPSTFGLKLLLWYSEMQRNLTRFDAAAEDLRVGKLSGAVGTFGVDRSLGCVGCDGDGNAAGSWRFNRLSSTAMFSGSDWAEAGCRPP